MYNFFMQFQKIGKIILTYFEELIVFSLVAMVIYMEIQLSYDVLTQEQGSFFNLDYFVEGFMYLFPLIAIITLLCAMFYLIRHIHTFGEWFTGYFILCAIVWFVIIPFWHIYFPQYRDVVLFRDYADSIVPQIVPIPKVFRFFVERCTIIHQIGYIFAEKGYFPMLVISPFGVAVSCLVCLRNISSWRLINCFTIIFMFLVLVVSNSYLFDPRFISSSEIFQKMGYWVPFMFNLIAAVVLILIGIICHLVRRSDPNREAAI